MEDAERLNGYRAQLRTHLSARPEARFVYLHGSAAKGRPYRDPEQVDRK